jgi:hypothetical protein
MPKGDPQSFAKKEGHLLMLVGRAISEWSAIELVVLQTYAWATRTSMENAAQLLKPVMMFKTVFDITDVAMRIRIEDHATLKHWESVAEYIRKLATKRNYVAHSPVVAMSKTDKHPDDASWEDAVPQIGPSLSSYLISDTRRQPIKTEEMLEILEEFDDALHIMCDFLTALVELESQRIPLPQKFCEPVSRDRSARKKRQEGRPEARWTQRISSRV